VNTQSDLKLFAFPSILEVLAGANTLAYLSVPAENKKLNDLADNSGSEDDDEDEDEGHFSDHERLQPDFLSFENERIR